MNIFDHILPSSFSNEKCFWTKFLDKIKTHILYSITLSHCFFFNCTIYEMTWKIIVGPGRQQMTVWCMCIAYWVTKATNTHSQNMQYLLIFRCTNGYMTMPQCYIIYTNIACLVNFVLDYKTTPSFSEDEV